MEIGWCAGLAEAGRVRAAGFDYLEVGLAPMQLEDDRAFIQAMTAVSSSHLPCAVFNQFLPRGMHVVGPAVDRGRIQNYLVRATSVARAAGARLVVFGSGWARNVPDGWSLDRARGQFIETVLWAADALSRSGAMLALEAQNRKETNLLTTLAEAVELVRAIGRPDIAVIADTYHLHEEGEGLDVVAGAFDRIAHVHVSDSGRHLPGRGTYDFDAFFSYLAAHDYRGRLSVEMMREVTDDELRTGLEFVRSRCPR